MPPLTVAAFANLMADAQGVDHAFCALRTQLDEVARGLELAYFRYDPRRKVVAERLSLVGGQLAREALELSLDHLPPKIRRDLLGGGALVDFGDQSGDYLKFFRMEPGDGFLLLQAVRFDGELCGLIAVREPRQLFGSRAAERIAAPIGLFAMSLTQCAERQARREAERALEELLAKTHSEYGRTLADLRTELDRARNQLTVGGANEHVVELERAARAAADEARAAFARLEAVEHQVAAAVSQLEKAHLDLSRQSEALRNQSNLLHRIERLLVEGADDPRRAIEEVLAAVSSRVTAQGG
jgi:hypothetical protein